MNDQPSPPPPIDHDVAATSDGAATLVEQGRGRTFPCAECGGDLVFHIGRQALKCPYCGRVQELELDDDATIAEQDFHAALEKLREVRERNRDQQAGRKEVTCDGCGGTTVFTGTLTASECPYCGKPVALEGVHDAAHRVPVDGVLPFLIDRETARTNLHEWVKSRWFAPNDFKKRGVEGRFNGVYLPYWTYDALTFTRYSGERGEEYTVTVGTGDDKRTETRVRWYPASGAFQRFFDDVLVLGTRGLDRKLMQNLEPWPLHRCLPFTQDVMSGYLARTYEVELAPAFQDAKRRIEEALERDVRERIGGDRQRVHSIDTRYDAITFKHLLLPVWLLAYRYKDEAYQVMVNAGTGEVQGERPWSWVKIALAVLAGIALVGATLFLFNR